jgi:TolB-like protein
MVSINPKHFTHFVLKPSLLLKMGLGILLGFGLWGSDAQAAENIAVLDLIAKNGLTQAEASTLTDRVRSLVIRHGQYQILERENIERILKEQGFQSTQNCEDTQCSLEIGRLLAVKQIMTGSVSKLGNLYAINLRIIDVQNGRVVRDEYEDCVCLLETVLTQSVPNVVTKILGGQKQPAITPSATPVNPAPVGDPNLPLRTFKPHQLYLEGGAPLPSVYGIAYGGFKNPRYTSLGYLYHLTDYLALGGQLGLEGLITTVNPFLQVNGRVYTNPHPLAGFFELGLGAYAVPSTNPVISAKLGLENRWQNGWTVGISGGAVYIPTRNDWAPTLEGYLGYAF